MRGYFQRKPDWLVRPLGQPHELRHGRQLWRQHFAVGVVFRCNRFGVLHHLCQVKGIRRRALLAGLGDALALFIEPYSIDLLTLVVGTIGQAPGQAKEEAALFLHAQATDAGIDGAHRSEQRFAATVTHRRTQHRECALPVEQRHHLVEDAAAVGDQLPFAFRLPAVKAQGEALAPKVRGQIFGQQHVESRLVGRCVLRDGSAEFGKVFASELEKRVIGRRRRRRRLGSARHRSALYRQDYHQRKPRPFLHYAK